jgi:Tol biopolymer transport system component/predicted Ser/Thr protein kinase
MSLSVGDKLGPYEILSPIGAGGMGEVWKARDTRLDRVVAIKISSEKFGERFDREARAIAALNHPNICQIYDVGPDYIVMEYVEGSEIKGPMPFHIALKAAIQLAGALEAAHRRSITHRDLKPANILMTKSGVKVLDFGLAKFEVLKPEADEATQTRALTEEGSIVGTLQYMAPEQLQGKPTDARSDIFSLGCVLYEILTGKRAFRAENQATLIASIMDREPEPIAAHQPMIPPVLDRMVKKCLAKDPDERWQTAADLKSEMQWVLDGGSQAAMSAPVVEQRRRNPRLGWILAGVFAALFVGLAVFDLRTASAPAKIVRFEIPLPEGTSWGPNDFPAVSPDGTRILWTGMKRDGTASLWMRPMDSLIAQPIPGTEGSRVNTGAWSPDGRSIAYVADGKLFRVEISGGAPQVLSSPAIGWVAWNSAGIILFTHGDGALSSNPLYRIPASGGEAKPAMASGTSQFGPSFLPDGRAFLYRGGGVPTQGLFIGTLDAKEGKRITDAASGVFVPPSWLVYVRGSHLLAQSFDAGTQSLSGDPIRIADQIATSLANTGEFSVSQNGVLAYRKAIPPSPNDLTWYDRQGTRLGTVGGPGAYTGPALSPDGKRLAVARLDPALNTRDIWVLDQARGVSSRFTFGNTDEINPTWSPDGLQIAFSSPRKDATRRGIYRKAANGVGAEETLLEDTGNDAVEDWSPDGKLLLFNVDSHDVDALPLTGDRKPYPVLKAAFPQDHARLSPDGRWIAYVSLESGRREVFVQNFPAAGGKWQVSNNGGTEPSWRGDGRELYFIEGADFKAVEVKAAGSSFEAGIPKTLFAVQLDSINRRSRYVATPDGKRFLFVTTPRSIDTTPFIVVQNWQTLLKH